MHAVGLSHTKNLDGTGPLHPEQRYRFNTWRDEAKGYFDHIAPAFEHYAERDCKTSIRSMNVLIRLHGEDLYDALEICDRLELDLAEYPEEWRVALGTKLPSGRPPREIRPLLRRVEALRRINLLRGLLQRAAAEKAAVVYGSGMLYRGLWR